MGFTPWAVDSDSFDFSYLLTAHYLTEAGIPYSNPEEYYDAYSLPTILSYTAGPYLGAITLEVTDTEGNPVQINGETGQNIFLDNCSQFREQKGGVL